MTYVNDKGRLEQQEGNESDKVFLSAHKKLKQKPEKGLHLSPAKFVQKRKNKPILTKNSAIH